jgi:hypothetical protein
MFQVALAVGALAVVVKGDAVIGDGNVILGVADAGHLNIPYKGGVLGLPASDPAGIDFIGLRNPKGDITAVERGCLCEGWGVGIRRRDGTFDDECGAEASMLTNINIDRFKGKDGDRHASSSVICGAQEKLWVRHQYRPGRCRGLYEVKITIENLGCDDIRDDIIYRRVMDWDIDPTPFSELVTIQGKGSPFFDNASDNGFCSMLPSNACIGKAPDFIDDGPTDHGAHFDLNVGRLRSRERMVFRIFYGYFRSERDAERCVDDNGYELYSFGQDERERNTFVWAFRPHVDRYKLRRPEGKCVRAPRTRPDDRRSAPAETTSARAADAEPAEMTEEEKRAQNTA